MNKSTLGYIVGILATATTMSSYAEEPGNDAVPLQVSKAGASVSQIYIPLDCAKTGNSEFPYARITNTTGETIPAGWSVIWATTVSTGTAQSGYYKLPNKLAPNDTAQFNINANANGCTAKIAVGKPDLVVLNAKWIDDTHATVELKNTNPFAAAGSSVVRFQASKCAGYSLTQFASKDTSAISIGKGEKKTVKVQLPKGVYLNVTADATNQVSESDESNNQAAYGSLSACVG